MCAWHRRDEPQRKRRDRERKLPNRQKRQRQIREHRRCHERLCAEFMSLVEGMEDGIQVSDENGRPLRCNAAYSRILQEMLGVRMEPGMQPQSRLEDPETVSLWKELHRKVLAGESFQVEFGVPAGEKRGLRHYEFSFCPIRENETIFGFTEIARDITDRKRMEADLSRVRRELEDKLQTCTEALKHTEREYRELFENADIGIFRAASDGTLLKANPKCAEIFGYRSPERLLTHLTRTSQFYADSSAREAVLKDLERDGFVRDATIESRTRKGRQLWLNLNALEVSQPDGSRMVEGFVQDITKRHRIAESLRRSEAHLRSLMENASGFVVYRLVGDDTAPEKLRVVFISPSAADILGISEPANFESWFKQLHPEDAPRVAEANRLAYFSGRFEEQFRFYHHGLEQWRWIHAISSGGVEGPGSRFYVNGIMVDITDKKETEMALQRREQELHQKAAALEELNTALRVVIEKKSEDQENFEKKLLIHARMLIQPYIEKLRNTKLSDRQDGMLNILESNLDEMFSGLPKRMSSAFVGLTRQEMQIASLIRRGKTSRQIAAMLDLSPRTIDTHRANLRRKLGLKSKKTNLRSYLLSLQE